MRKRLSSALIVFAALICIFLQHPLSVAAQEALTGEESLEADSTNETIDSKDFSGILSDEEVKEEFPLWARDLRRAEIVAFGSLPFTLFLSRIGVDTWRWSNNSWDMQYAPWPLKGTSAVDMTSDEARASIAIAFGISTLIAIADHLIVRHKRTQAQVQAQKRPRATLEIEAFEPEDTGPEPPKDRGDKTEETPPDSKKADLQNDEVPGAP